MDNLDFIFNEEQYNQLKKEYNKLLTPIPSTIISTLNTIINTLQHTSFRLQLNVQNEVMHNLCNAEQVLHIIYTSKPSPSPRFAGTPYNLIYHLTNISTELTSITLKSPYQTLLLKANSFVLQSIKIICENFLDKNSKTLRF